jgi:HAD superfamily hydrolase (TIGR01509 family)
MNRARRGFAPASTTGGQMGLLDGIEVACFDLFDTLIRIDTERLPALEWDGATVRSTIPVLHDRIFAPRGVELADLVSAIRSMWAEVRAELRGVDGPGGERWREVPAIEKYRRLLQRFAEVDEDEVGQLAEVIADTHHQMLVSSALAVDGAEAVLARVRDRGVPTVLVSNWDHARAGAAMLEQTHLAPLLDHIVISEAVGFRKPHAKIFEQGLAPFGATPETAMHVGDQPEADVWGAGRLGFKTVWIDAGDKGWPEELTPEPSLTVTRLSDLLREL